MARLWKNSATTTLASGITNIATSLTVASGTGTLFPAISGTDYFVVALETVAGAQEIVRVTARSTDTFTISRAQEGTTAIAFSTGDRLELRVTAQAMTNAVDVNEPITLPAQSSVPAAPSAGNVTIYARTRASRTMLEFICAGGTETRFQPALFLNRVMMWLPGSSTAVGSFGLTPTTAATLSHPTPATTTFAESLYRTRFTTSGTAGNASGIRDAVNTMWRGNSAGRGGFHTHFRFTTSGVALAGGQIIVGLSSSTGAIAGEPSALTDVVGIVKDIADTNLFFARRTGAGTVQKVNLGVAYAVNQTFDLDIFCRPNWDRIGVRVTQHDFAGGVTVLLDTEYTTDLPANTTLLGRHLQVRNGSTASAASLDLVRAYTESDS